MEEYSVFDIIGPRMSGPSSSHTAGAVRLAHVARHIAGMDVAEAAFTLYGSFAETGKGHGTDKALIAGTLGMEPDDARIKNAYEIARERGMRVDIAYSDEPVDHPNTARIRIIGSDGRQTEVIGQSIGGGAIRIVEINGLDVELSGEYPTLVIQHDDQPGVIAQVSALLADHGVNIAFMRVFRHGRGEDAYMTIETDGVIAPKIGEEILQRCNGVIRLFTV
ncbi:MAG: L-serine ammonia-lyase, iron-sulfur-dependent subunit beta [Clostridia bacterium]|nr:L-serine ammonia-lyase, iron-sulfur-dependent subunit beta [Clostridia bacterium]